MIIKDLTDTSYECDYCDDRSCSICTLLSALRKARYDATIVNKFKEGAKDEKVSDDEMVGIYELCIKDAFFCDIILAMSKTAEKRLEWFNKLEKSSMAILDARKKLRDKIEEEAKA